MSDIEKYVDQAMFAAAPMQSVQPQAHLIWMTPDPLGAVAAAVRMYKGQPTYSLADISDSERMEYWKDVQRTELLAPMEFIKVHFFFEGVDRSLTHQAVRQRTAVYAQESLRFAVKDARLIEETSRPPSLDDPTRSQSMRNDLEDSWTRAMDAIEQEYKFLIANGMPAEDARGVLPGAVLTRYNYATDLRNLRAEAGKRMCTQAQFIWRKQFASIVEAIREYRPDFSFMLDPGLEREVEAHWAERYAWQFEMIADSNIFAPVCYHLGKCGFKAEFDRGCTIRERVDANEAIGRAPEHWSMDCRTPATTEELSMDPGMDTSVVRIPAIRRVEWEDDPKAAWVR